MKTRWISLIVLLALVLAGCGQGGDGSPLEPQVPSSLDTEVPSKATSSENGTPTPDSSSQEVATPDRINGMSNTPERVPPTEMLPSVTGEVPDELLGTIAADLMKRTGVAPDRILVIQAQAITYNDGSLGCPQPGILYTQALVNGYWVVLEVDGVKYDYRASGSGYFPLRKWTSSHLSPSHPKF